MSEKPNCYDCIHRRDLPGNAHSACRHPNVMQGPSASPLVEILSMLGSIPPVAPERLGVRGNPHGIRSGWFGWPLNFDPVWLESCDGFEARASANNAPQPKTTPVRAQGKPP